MLYYMWNSIMQKKFIQSTETFKEAGYIACCGLVLHTELHMFNNFMLKYHFLSSLFSVI